MKEDEIERRIKGFIAEKIFELMHKELNCIVYHTGHETIFRDILATSNKIKKPIIRR